MMMDARVKRITDVVSRYDKALYAVKTHSGMIQIWRDGQNFSDEAIMEEFAVEPLRSTPQFILALTDNWNLRGNPCDWGLEPILAKLRSMDSWREDTIYSNLVKEREKQADLSEKRRSSNVRAMAYDMRKDFAKSTDHINTSTLEKVERRQ